MRPAQITRRHEVLHTTLTAATAAETQSDSRPPCPRQLTPPSTLWARTGLFHLGSHGEGHANLASTRLRICLTVTCVRYPNDHEYEKGYHCYDHDDAAYPETASHFIGYFILPHVTRPLKSSHTAHCYGADPYNTRWRILYIARKVHIQMRHFVHGRACSAVRLRPEDSNQHACSYASIVHSHSAARSRSSESQTGVWDENASGPHHDGAPTPAPSHAPPRDSPPDRGPHHKSLPHHSRGV